MYNWARTVKLCEKDQLIKPRDEQELIEILRTRRPHQKVKVKGSGMSCLGIGALDTLAQNPVDGDILVDLSTFTGLVELDSNEATFGAATTLQEVSDILLKRGRQLTACAGVLLTQTLAGAIATGTHGQGFRNGGLYDSVRRIRVILANATAHDYSRDDANPDMFDALRLHLGCLGILTLITLETEPAKTYKLVKAVTNYDDLYANYLTWNETSSHCKAWWFPHTDHVQVWRSFVASQQENNCYIQNGRNITPTTSTSSCQDSTFFHSIDHLVEKMDEDTKGHGEIVSTSTSSTDSTEPDPFNEHNARFRTVTRFRSLESCIGNMYQLWCKGVPAPQINCEVAIPIDKLPNALERLHAYVAESHRELHYPFILRATGSSSAWLSPSFSQRVVYIGFLVYLSEEDYSAKKQSYEILKEVEEILSEFGAIPHYGKFFTRDLYDFSQLLPKWHKFIDLRKRVDPQGIFLNSFLKQLFRESTTFNRVGHFISKL